MDRARRAVAPAVLVAVALTLASGCTATNEQTTTWGYDPSDGENVQLGRVRAASLMVISAGGDAPGTLVTRLVNGSDQPHTVTIRSEGDSGLDESFRVPPRSTLAIGPDEDTTVVVDPVGAQPGKLIPVTVSADGGRAQRVEVPVLTGTLPEYATLVPTPSPTSTSPEPTGSPSGSPSGSSRSSGGSSRSSGPVVTSTATDSPSGGASESSSQRPRTLSPSGSPTG